MAACAHGVACARTGEPASGTASRATSAPTTISRLITSGVLLSSGPIFLARTQRGDAVTVYDRPFGRYYEDFEVGDVYKHWPGKTITEYDDHLFCMITMNHHPLHTNVWFAENETVHKKNVVVGNLVYSLVLGMSVPDVSGSCIANLEGESLSHKKPTFHGDTIYAETHVLEKVESKSKNDRGVVTVETKAFNQRGEEVCYFRRKLMVWKKDSAPVRQRPYGEDVWGE